MASHYEVATRWAERGRPLRNRNMFAEGNVIYSYGYHFPMGVALDEQRVFLLNGDRYSATTSGHQSDVRGAAQRREGWRTVIIPFSALGAAGAIETNRYYGERVVVPNDFKVLDELPERNEYKCDQCGIDWTSGHLEYDHYGHEGRGFRHLLGGCLFRASGKHYLTGFDDTAVRRFGAGFFLVELAGKPRTYADAIESLKPRIVKDAITAGLDVKRQGDIFAIPVDTPTRQVKGETVKMVRVLEQNHVCSEVRVTSGAVRNKTFARGVIYHRPGNWRRAEHRRIQLGKSWHLMVRNAAVASFAASGYVD